MNVPILLAFLSLAVVLTASATAAPPPPESQQEQVHLRFQSHHTSQFGLTLHFSGYHDRRCPDDVLCASPGYAYGFFWITGPDIEAQILSLPLARWSRHPGLVQLGRYELTLTSIRPGRLLRTPVPPNEYEAIVAVTVNSSH